LTVVSPELAARWNWGAFFLAPVWPFCHGLPLVGALAAILWVAALPSTLFLSIGVVSGMPRGDDTAAFAATDLLYVALAAYLGKRGSALAVARRPYAGDAEFVAVERAWTFWGIAAFIAAVTILPLAGILAAAFLAATAVRAAG
jgi:hypothetical protein